MSIIKDYFKLFRLNQPTGIWLLFLPSLAGIFLALKTLDNPVETIGLFTILEIIFLFFIGAIIMRPAGCVMNDILDQKFDQKVERTKTRPIASGRISQKEALIAVAVLIALGFGILLQFNQKTIISGFFAVILVATYPLMKRVTYYPQLFLGLTFNFGILMASLATIETIPLESFILYFICIIWTLIYDTIYAYQDIEDDLKIGVKSTAIKFQDNPKKVLTALNLLMFSSLLLLGWIAEFSAEFFLVSLLIDLFLSFKINRCDFQDRQSCQKTFKSNIWVGVWLVIAILLA
jgi:4-hydroxybenzoate polyprenyltransferase